MRAATWTTTTSKNNNTASLLLSSALRRKMLSPSSSSSSSFALNHHFRGGKKSAVNVTTPRRGGGGGGRFGGGLRTNASNKNTSAGECELVECEVDFATKDDDEKEDAFGASLTTIKACVANINGNTIDASALRNVTVMNTDGNLETPIPLTGDKDVVVYLRHLG